MDAPTHCAALPLRPRWHEIAHLPSFPTPPPAGLMFAPPRGDAREAGAAGAGAGLSLPAGGGLGFGAIVGVAAGERGDERVLRRPGARGSARAGRGHHHDDHDHDDGDGDGDGDWADGEADESEDEDGDEEEDDVAALGLAEGTSNVLPGRPGGHGAAASRSTGGSSAPSTRVAAAAVPTPVSQPSTMFRAMGGTDADLLLQMVTGWDTDEWRAVVTEGAEPPKPATNAGWVARRQYVLTHLLDGIAGTAAKVEDTAAAVAKGGGGNGAWKVLPTTSMPEHAPSHTSGSGGGWSGASHVAAIRQAIAACVTGGIADIPTLAAAVTAPGRHLLTAATGTLSLHEPVMEMPLLSWGAAAWCCLLATVPSGDAPVGAIGDATGGELAKAGRAVAAAVDVVCGLPRGTVTSVMTLLGLWKHAPSPAAATEAAMRAALAAPTRPAGSAHGDRTVPRAAPTVVGAAAEAALAAAELALLAQMRRGAFGR